MWYVVRIRKFCLVASSIYVSSSSSFVLLEEKKHEKAHGIMTILLMIDVVRVVEKVAKCRLCVCWVWLPCVGGEICAAEAATSLFENPSSPTKTNTQSPGTFFCHSKYTRMVGPQLVYSARLMSCTGPRRVSRRNCRDMIEVM